MLRRSMLIMLIMLVVVLALGGYKRFKRNADRRICQPVAS